MKTITAIGIDPGVAKCGLAVVRATAVGTSVLAVELVETSSKDDHQLRIDTIADRLVQMIDQCEPDVIGYEEQGWVLVGKSQQNGGQEINATARRILEVTGAIRGVAVCNNMPCYAIAISTIKKGLTGSGRASKDQMKACAQRLVGPNRRLSEHTADAIGAGVVAARRFFAETQRRAACGEN